MSTITTTIKLRQVQKTPVFNLRHALAECDNSFVLRHDDVKIVIARIENDDYESIGTSTGYVMVSIFESRENILKGAMSNPTYTCYESDGDPIFEAYLLLRDRYTDAQLRRMYDHATTEEGN